MDCCRNKNTTLPVLVILISEEAGDSQFFLKQTPLSADETKLLEYCKNNHDTTSVKMALLLVETGLPLIERYYASDEFTELAKAIIANPAYNPMEGDTWQSGPDSMHQGINASVFYFFNFW